MARLSCFNRWPAAHSRNNLECGKSFKNGTTSGREKTKDIEESRTFGSLFKVLDAEFQRDSHDRSLMEMHHFQPPKRGRGEDIFTFWIRFNKITSDIAETRLDLKSELDVLRALQALGIPTNGRLSILSAMNLQAKHNCPKALRITTRRLLARPIKSEDVLMESQVNEWGGDVDMEESSLAKIR